ncbi:hypothetical protein H4R35_004804 [Dimargaris xerosporica]|nr:hypothetical protein H4R35_004804 [Dimargaris xerosporica]
MTSTTHRSAASLATNTTTGSCDQHATLKDRIRQQVEYYFSPDNLVHDAYLCSQMDPQGNVPIIIVAAFKKLRALTPDVSLIVDAMKESTTVAMDDEQKYFRPNFPREHRVLLLSQVPESCTREDIVALCDNLKSVPLIDLYPCDAITWEIRLATEREAQRLLDYVQDQSLGGAPIKASLKAEPLFQGTWWANVPQPFYQDRTAPYAGSLFVPPGQSYNFPYIPYYDNSSMVAGVAPGYPGGNYYGYYPAPYYTPTYYPEANRHQSPRRRNRNGKSNRKSGPGKKADAGAKSNRAGGSPRRSNRKNSHKAAAGQPLSPHGHKTPVSAHKASIKTSAKSQPVVQPADSVVDTVTPPPSPKDAPTSTKASQPTDRDAIANSDTASRPLTPVSEKPLTTTPPNELTGPLALPSGKKGMRKMPGHRSKAQSKAPDQSTQAKGPNRPVVVSSPDLQTQSFPPLPVKPTPAQERVKAKHTLPTLARPATLAPVPGSPARPKTLADIVKGSATSASSHSSSQPAPLHDEYPGLVSDSSSGETSDTVSVTSSLASSTDFMAPTATTTLPPVSLLTASAKTPSYTPQHPTDMAPTTYSYAQALRQPAVKSR